MAAGPDVGSHGNGMLALAGAGPGADDGDLTHISRDDGPRDVKRPAVQPREAYGRRCFLVA